MKRWGWPGLLLACMLVCLSGCMIRMDDGPGSEREVKEAESKDSIEILKEPESDKDRETSGPGQSIQEETGERPGPDQSIQETENHPGHDAEPEELTNRELRDFTNWLNQGSGNYGFLLSEYGDPRDVDLDEVFYAGAGLECDPPNEAVEKAYLAVTGQEEIYTDCTCLTTDQIDGFLQKKLGLSYEDMSKPLSWIYLPEFDLYIHEHGDTNYMGFVCVSGRRTGDTYELECVPGDGEFASLYPSRRVTLRRSGDEYQFASNQYVEGIPYSKEVWRIDEQSFETELTGWGSVTFVSYAPNVSMYWTNDAVFELQRDGETLYTLPYVMEENYRERELFRQILAVSFADYNKDGDTDIIILIEYEPIYTTEANETLIEVRLYQNEPDRQEFTIDFEKMDELTLNGWNHSIGEVMEHLTGT